MYGIFSIIIKSVHKKTILFQPRKPPLGFFVDNRIIGCDKRNNIFLFVLNLEVLHWKYFYLLDVLLIHRNGSWFSQDFIENLSFFLLGCRRYYFWCDRGGHYRMVSCRQYSLVCNKYQFQLDCLSVRVFLQLGNLKLVLSFHFHKRFQDFQK